jgi:hypothetical protein
VEFPPLGTHIHRIGTPVFFRCKGRRASAPGFLKAQPRIRIELFITNLFLDMVAENP